VEYGVSAQIIQPFLRQTLENVCLVRVRTFQSFLWKISCNGRNINLAWGGKWVQCQECVFRLPQENSPSQAGVTCKQGSQKLHRNWTRIWQLESSQVPFAGVLLQPAAGEMQHPRLSIQTGSKKHLML